MRAIFFETEIDTGKVLQLDELSAHHLNVVRVKLNEKILIINGHGKKGTAEVLEISKKQGLVKVLSVEEQPRNHFVSIAFCVPKKDAAEDIIKMAVELGVYKIFPLSSEYSQFEIEESERLNRIIESALIQSNNLYWPIIHKQQPLKEFLKNSTSKLIYFSSTDKKLDDFSLDNKNEVIILIGPEGGLSLEEEEKVNSLDHKFVINLPTPILRAPTAVAASIGYLLAKLK